MPLREVGVACGVLGGVVVAKEAKCEEERDRRLGARRWWERKVHPYSSLPFKVRIVRSERAVLLMSDSEVSKVAHVINAVVDLPFYDEEEEQDIFEFCVARLVEHLAGDLPLSIIYHVHSEEAVDKAHAKDMEERLKKYLYSKCETELPFLEGGDRRKVAQCLLVLLLRSMRKPKSQVGA